MDLKFYLNKFVKLEGIEGYSLNTLMEAKKCYEKFIEKTNGFDPDFPETDFSGGKKGKKIGGVNKSKVDEARGEESEDLGRIAGYDDSDSSLQLRKSEPGNGKMRDPNRGRKSKGKKR